MNTAPSRSAHRAEIRALLEPRRMALHRAWVSPGSRRQRWLLLVPVSAVGVAIFLFFRRVLLFFLGVPEVGPDLTHRLLSMVLAAVFSLLIFSNLVTAIATFFLSKEMDRLVTAPVRWSSLFLARSVETMVESSWMVLVFAGPAFLAYGVAHGAGPLFYGAVVVTLPPLLVVASVLGIVVAIGVVNLVPARRAREILLLLTVVVVAGLYLLLRFLQPERLLQPEGFDDFADFVAALRVPLSPWLPSVWVTEVLHPTLGGRIGGGGRYLFLLWASALALPTLAEWGLPRLFLRGFSRAQEGGRGRHVGEPLWERFLRRLPFLPPGMADLLSREARTFLRDTGQWSQMILLAALIVVYVYNFRVLPDVGGPVVTFYFRNLVAFLNLALTGFVLTAIALRFLFPSFSLEGKALWIVRTAPLPLRRVWWSKFWPGTLGLLALGWILIAATNHYLDVVRPLRWIGLLTVLGWAPALTALALALGATYPKFDADNPARAATGLGGLVFTVAGLTMVGVVVLLEAVPVYAWFTQRLTEAPLPWGMWVGVIGALLLAVVLTAGVGWLSVRHGQRALEEMQP